MQEIREIFGANKSSVCWIAFKVWTTNIVERKAGSGCLRKSTQREYSQMIRLIKADPRMEAVDVTKFANEQMGIFIGVHTVRHRLNDSNLFARRPASN